MLCHHIVVSMACVVADFLIFFKSKDHSSKAIKAMICRSTVIPSHQRKENIIAQSMR